MVSFGSNSFEIIITLTYRRYDSSSADVPSPQASNPNLHSRHPAKRSDQTYIQPFASNPYTNAAVAGIGSLFGNTSTDAYSPYDSDDFSNEPPLLEELGIRFDHIWSKTRAVILLTKIDESILDDTDLAGPVFFCLLLGASLLMSGKVHFGYIYGFSVMGCFGMFLLLNLLHATGIDFWRTCSVLGYGLLPVIGLAVLTIFMSLKGVLGSVLSVIVILWSTFAVSRILDAKLELTDTFWLVVYPVALLYSCFVLITIF